MTPRELIHECALLRFALEQGRFEQVRSSMNLLVGRVNTELPEGERLVMPRADLDARSVPALAAFSARVVREAQHAAIDLPAMMSMELVDLPSLTPEQRDHMTTFEEIRLALDRLAAE